PDEVLDAALELFIEQGFAQTRVDDIARRAGISKGAVYLYFASKEKILEALVRRAIVPIADNALGFVSDFEGDPRPVITMVMKMLAGRFADPKVFAIPKLILREVLSFPELAVMYRREVLDRVIPAVEAMIARGTDQGYFRAVDPHLTIRSIIGPLLLHVIMAEVFDIMPEGGLHFDKLIDNHLTILFDGLSAPPNAKQWSSS
ncbi:MAG TPA: TetR/AcrR family transcriptional regulator, partial [Devosia sp.]